MSTSVSHSPYIYIYIYICIFMYIYGAPLYHTLLIYINDRWIGRKIDRKIDR